MGALTRFVTSILPPLREFIVQKIVPAVEKFGAVLGAFVTKYGKQVAEWVQGVLAWFGKLIGGTGDVEEKGGNALGGFLKSVGNLVTTVVKAVGSILTALGELVGWFLFNDGGELRAWAKVVLGIFTTIIDTVSTVIDWIARLVRALGSLLRGDLPGAMYELTKFNGSTAGMVPLYDANGNRIGWQSEEQAKLKQGLQSSQQTTNNVTVNITSGDNARQLGRDLSLSVQDALRAVGAQ